MQWEIVDDKEKEWIIKRLSRNFPEKVIRKILDNKFIIKMKNGKKEYFIVENEKVLEKFTQLIKYRNPYYISWFGFDTIKKQFRISFEFAQEIANNTEEKKVYVNEKGEQMFLFGRDIFEEAIIKWGEKIKLGDIVIVVNKNNEALGLGKIISWEGVCIKNLWDRGWYLRHGE